MELLRPAVNLDTFFKSVAEAEQSILLLDYDGTLSPFAEDHTQATPYPGVKEVVLQIDNESRTRLVIVSGRSIADLRRLLGINPLPELWGSHGFERLTRDGTYLVREIRAGATEELKSIRMRLEEQGLEEYVELKPAGLAVHWRGQPESVAERLKDMIHEWPSDRLDDNGLYRKEFDGGLEIRPRGANKGEATKRVLRESRKESPIAFLGDDLTDEDAFAVLQERGLSVLVRPEYRETMADVWLQPPKELMAFLVRWGAAAAAR